MVAGSAHDLFLPVALEEMKGGSLSNLLDLHIHRMGKSP
jgi:hypothetical protein